MLRRMGTIRPTKSPTLPADIAADQNRNVHGKKHTSNSWNRPVKKKIQEGQNCCYHVLLKIVLSYLTLLFAQKIQKYTYPVSFLYLPGINYACLFLNLPLLRERLQPGTLASASCFIYYNGQGALRQENMKIQGWRYFTMFCDKRRIT